jgi:hypothetical protein
MPSNRIEPIWSDWQPLFQAGRNKAISRDAGLYRIRRVGQPHLDYIGQTGRSLRQRLGMLSGVYRDIMPYATRTQPDRPYGR